MKANVVSHRGRAGFFHGLLFFCAWEYVWRENIWRKNLSGAEKIDEGFC
jgi:hypothetical protein